MLIHLVGYGVLAVILGWFFCFPQVPNVLPEHHKQTMGHQKTLLLALESDCCDFYFDFRYLSKMLELLHFLVTSAFDIIFVAWL
jgi:hypothetical protein